ncbi:MAG: hypothetical protein HY749_18025 [Gammaproteobacteria bacterium]|nr:hypothetical protein [Gammaproteobacteria bacterium]
MAKLADQERRSDLRRILATSIFGILGRSSRLAINVGLIGYAVAKLDAQTWAITAIAASLSSYLGLLQLGASSGIGRLLGEAVATRSQDSFVERYSASWVVCGLVSVAVVSVAVLLARLGFGRLDIPVPLHEDAYAALVFTVISVVLTTCNLVSIGTLQAIGKLELFLGAEFGAAIARALLTVLGFELLHPTAAVYTGALAAANLLLLLWCNWGMTRSLGPERARFRWPSIAALKKAFLFNSLAFADSIIYVGFLQSPVFLLRPDLVQIGAYGLFVQVNNVLRTLIGPTSQSLSALLVSYRATGQHERLDRTFAASSKTFFAIGGVVSAELVVFGQEMLSLWLHNVELLNSLASAWPYLAMMIGMGIAAIPSAVFLVSVGRIEFPALIGIVILLIFLTVAHRITSASDEPGRFVDTAVVLLIAYGLHQVIRIIFAWSTLSVAERKLPFAGLAASSLFSLVVAGTAAFLGKSLDHTSAAQLILGVSLLAIISVACWWSVMLTPGERAMILKKRPASESKEV